MLNPTPMLRPSPLDIAGLFAGSFEALRRRLGVFVVTVLLPVVVMIVWFVAIAVTIGGMGLTTFGRFDWSRFWLFLVILSGGGVLVGLATLKSSGMMSRAAYEVAQDRRPTVGSLFSDTKGYLPRLFPLLLAVTGVVLAFYLILLGIVFTLISSRSDSASAIVGLLFVVLALAAFPVAFFLWTKTQYVVPAIAIEGLGGMAALRRSWSLTKGNFWRTFGYAILPQLGVSVLTWFANAFAGGASTALERASENLGNPRALGYLVAAVPALLLVLGLQSAIAVITTPFLQCYQTYMFVDQVRRSEYDPQQGGAPSYPYTGYGQGYPQAAQSSAQGGQWPRQAGAQPWVQPGTQPWGQQPGAQQWPHHPGTQQWGHQPGARSGTQPWAPDGGPQQPGQQPGGYPSSNPWSQDGPQAGGPRWPQQPPQS